MLQRISKVDSIFVKSALFSSTILIGDAMRIFGNSRALAVQREAELFFDDEGDFAQFKVFSEPVPLPVIHEPVIMDTFQEKPVIRVGTINVKGLSAASIIQVGSTPYISMEARIHHLRQLLEREETK
ncbi:spore germination protein GerPE [Neobacillus piezotolerans]|uniref:Spore germination protein GerPE n=1 Tax=Neobacillus piezotolerans TaxID=2259171 RepID=A0A3D8GMM8_9BACI|nr:spore germination protein GerPE [Neobacillus piezotolerans]RDU35522.1 spore germination protein GerPE [Neobacillus piezotolerans]